jgi:hypothetical protein
VYLSPSPAFQ